MEIKQVYSFLNNVCKQTTGFEDVSVVDAQGMVSLGNQVLSSTENTENFFGTIYDMTAKSIVNVRPYQAKVKSLMMDTFTFGAIMRKIYVDPMEARESAHWDIDDNNGAGKEYSPIFIVKPKVRIKIFSGIDTFEIDTAIPDIQIRSAFRDASEMAALIDGIYTSLENSMNLRLEVLAQTVYATMIANRIIYDTNPDNVTRTSKAKVLVDLRKEYNDFYGFESGDAGYLASKKQALSTPEFYRFASKTINDIIGYMEQLVQTFNTDGYLRHSGKDRLRVTMLHQFISAFNVYLQSDVWHNELTKLPNYVEVNYWQGGGTNWEDNDKIAIKCESYYTKDGEAKGFEVEQDGIVCLLTDVEAMGMTIDNQRRKSVYDPRHEVTAVYAKADKGYFVDPSENAVVFIVADAIATPTEVQ